MKFSATKFIIKSVLVLFTMRLLVCSFVGCVNTRKYNNIEFTNVKTNLTTSLSTDENNEKPEVEDTASHTSKVDINVNMQFMQYHDSTSQAACEAINKYIAANCLEIELKEWTSNTDSIIATFIDKRKQDFITENEMFSEEGIELFDHIEGKADYAYEGLILYTFTEEYYSGGAHPMHAKTYYMFRSDNGQIVTLYNIFRQDRTTDLRERIFKRLCEMNNVSDAAGLVEAGYFDFSEEDFPVSECFALREDEIEFYYDEYSIAPYSTGPTSIIMSFDELQDLMQ